MSKKRKRTELGREIAKLRIDFNETGAEMAEKVGMSASNLFNMETGAVSISFDFIDKIKEVYGKDLEPIYLNDGGLSKVTIELDELSTDERQLAVALWRQSTGRVLPSEDQKAILSAVELPGAEATPEAVVEQPSKKRKYKPPPLPDDVGFLSEEELDGLDDL